MSEKPPITPENNTSPEKSHEPDAYLGEAVPKIPNDEGAQKGVEKTLESLKNKAAEDHMETTHEDTPPTDEAVTKETEPEKKKTTLDAVLHDGKAVVKWGLGIFGFFWFSFLTLGKILWNGSKRLGEMKGSGGGGGGHGGGHAKKDPHGGGGHGGH